MVQLLIFPTLGSAIKIIEQETTEELKCMSSCPLASLVPHSIPPRVDFLGGHNVFLLFTFSTRKECLFTGLLVCLILPERRGSLSDHYSDITIFAWIKRHYENTEYTSSAILKAVYKLVSFSAPLHFSVLVTIFENCSFV